MYFILRPEDSAQLAMTPGIVGPAFVGLGVNGGSISGVTLIVSDALAADTALLVDASQLLTGSTPIVLDASENATLDMAGGCSNFEPVPEGLRGYPRRTNGRRARPARFCRAELL